MKQLTSLALARTLELNQRLARTAANGADWVLKRDTLIQSGRTWFELVHDGELMSVRYYALPDEESIALADGSEMPIERNQFDIPLVLVPPLAITSESFDLLPQRSLVRYMAAAGFKVYMVDWGKPTKEHDHLNLEDYADRMLGTALEKIRQHSGSDELSLMGWCMGGLFCLLHQGLKLDPTIRNMITVASPIDMDGNGGVVAAAAGVAQALDAPAQLVRNFTNLRINTLDPARLSLPDWATTAIFKLTDPISNVTTYWDLVTNLWDREFVKVHSTTSDYLNNLLRYPGGVVKDMAGGLLVDNQFASGKVQVGGQVAQLDKIRSNLLVFAGETDNLVSPEVAAKGVELVASEDKEFRTVPGGHMGVIIGGKAQDSVWKQTVEWLASRSG
jgi:polyhydroxyalkanoate synthase